VGGHGEAGFAAVDALVALTILTMTLVLAIASAEGARRAALAADEIHRARDLMRYLAETSAGEPGARQGRSGPFNWAVRVAPTDTAAAFGKLHACARHVDVTSRFTGRHFTLTTAALCTARASG
jgi:hypothetical protein